MVEKKRPTMSSVSVNLLVWEQELLVWLRQNTDCRANIGVWVNKNANFNFTVHYHEGKITKMNINRTIS